MMTDPANPSSSGSRRSLILSGSAVIIGLLAIGVFLSFSKHTPVPRLPRSLHHLQAGGIGDQWQLIGMDRDPTATPPKETWWLITTREGRERSESKIKPFSSVVAFSDKLWFFSPGMYRIYDGKDWQRFDAPWVGGDPTLTALPGQLWLLSRNGRNLSLISYTAGVWDRPRPVPVDPRDRDLICTEGCTSGIVAFRGKIYYYWLKNNELRQMSIDGVHPGRAESLGNMTAFTVLADADRIFLWYLIPAGSTPEGASAVEQTSIGLKVYDGSAWHEESPLERTAPPGRLEITALTFRGGNHLLINRGVQIEDQVWEQGRPVRSEFLVGGELGRDFLRYRARLLAQLALAMTAGFAVLSIVLSRWKAATESGVVFASVWRRFVAKAIDTSLILLPASAFIVAGLAKDGPLIVDSPQRLVPAGGFDLAILFAILWAYHAVAEGLWGQTLGKRICGITVMDEALKPCSVRQSVIRNLLRVIDILGFYWVGLVAISVTRRWQRLGDLAGRTIVVRTKP